VCVCVCVCVGKGGESARKAACGHIIIPRECVRSGPLSVVHQPDRTSAPTPPLPPNGFSYVENDRQVVRRAEAMFSFSTPRTAGYRAGDMCASRRSSARS